VRCSHGAFVLALAACPGAALAGTPPASEAPIATENAEAPVRIWTGRALDLEGKPVYSARSSFSETAAVATFSTRPVRSPGSTAAATMLSYQSPLAGAPLSSGFGMRRHPLLGSRRFHSGVDLAAPTGTPIRAASDGVVTSAGWNGGYGLLVSLGHGGNRETRYGHLSRLAVTAGQSVKRGEVIGYVGSTGRSTGPHLHYELRVNGIAVAPAGGVGN
jgi:murein DD-endopeptidase MepM/ murein hydrolase activator NlpD